MGRKPLSPNTVKLDIKIDADDKQVIVDAANKTGVSLSAFVRAAALAEATRLLGPAKRK